MGKVVLNGSYFSVLSLINRLTFKRSPASFGVGWQMLGQLPSL